MSNMQTAALPTDRELTARITIELIGLPDELRSLETVISALRQQVATCKAAADVAELDAVINAADKIGAGKNAEQRKVLQEQAVQVSNAVQHARASVAEAESALANAETDAKHLSRRWTAALALAELQAAKINFLARAGRASSHGDC